MPLKNLKQRKNVKFLMKTAVIVEIVEPSKVYIATFLLPCVSAKKPRK